tara:strand:+ start:1255 stop:1554 length:300 start_codon:yes stop_codon:yes gene_type:complete
MENSAKLQDQVRSINQLLSVIVGQKFARETDELKTSPSKRVRKCLELTLVEHKQATDSLAYDSDIGRKAMGQVHRKLDSLHSLSVLADCVEENLWDLNE